MEDGAGVEATVAGEDRPYGLWFPLLLSLVLQVVVVAYGTSPILDGGLLGPDSYMRLNRVTLLHDTGAWFDSTIPRSNAPYGEVLHWTRPFDVLLLAGAWLAAPFGDFGTALFWSGSLIGPLLQLFALIGLMWAARAVLDRRSVVLLGLLFLVQPAIIHYFFAGRVDHHGLNLLLFVVSLGLVIRILSEPFRAARCHVAGGIAAFSLWISIESLAVLLVNLAALTLFWAFSGRELDRKAFHFSAALFGGLAVVLLLERPWAGILQVEYDRVSIVHWMLAGSIWAFWGLVRLAGRGTTRPAARPIGRLAAATLWALLAGGLMWAAFPGFFRGPLADMDPRIVPILFDRIIEVQPLFDPRNPVFGPAVYWLGLALPALPFLAWTVWKPPGAADRTARVYLCIGLALYLPLAFYQVRWTGYAALLLLFPYTELLAGAIERTADIGARLRPLARALLVAAFCGVFTVLGLGLMKVEDGATDYSPTPPACRLDEAARHLDDPGGWGDRTRTVLAPVNFGPELLYRTRHRVVATPYHRNGRGILDAYRIMASTGGWEEARGLIGERRIDLILLCPNGAFDNPPGESPTLYRRLLEGQTPPWLREVPLPDRLAEGFRLFEVSR